MQESNIQTATPTLFIDSQTSNALDERSDETMQTRKRRITSGEPISALPATGKKAPLCTRAFRRIASRLRPLHQQHKRRIDQLIPQISLDCCQRPRRRKRWGDLRYYHHNQHLSALQNNSAAVGNCTSEPACQSNCNH